MPRKDRTTLCSDIHSWQQRDIAQISLEETPLFSSVVTDRRSRDPELWGGVGMLGGGEGVMRGGEKSFVLGSLRARDWPTYGES
jgi:hypothetical protein